jgi:hypothetical protein
MYIWPEYCAENSPLFNRWNTVEPDGMRLGGWDAAHGPVLYHIGYFYEEYQSVWMTSQP